ncbi:FHA domain-containing protein FhaB/FipA [Demequina sp.]|uniref:FHA domain-containing protein FhaB/FipA n=1 Tax=Demequina sp. TaxID=2050685 RepID=UPI003D0F6831
MSQLSVTLLRLGFLVLLWLLVLSSIGVLRADLYGTRVTARGRGRKAKAQPDAVAEKTAAPTRGGTGVRPQDEATPARLHVSSGPLKGTTLPLGSAPVLIGRAPTCTLVIDDDYASARHCRIFFEAGGWKVEDLGSTNGTFLGNQRVTDPVPLRRGDQVRIGATTVELAQ